MDTRTTFAHGIVLLCDSHHGVHLPLVWAKHQISCGAHWSILPEYLEALTRGPDSEEYWETWQLIKESAEFVDKNGRTWRLHHDGDLFAICEELLTDEERELFFES